MRYFIPHKTSIYFTMPIFTQRNRIWHKVYGMANATQLKKAQVKQNIVLKVLFNKDFFNTYRLSPQRTGSTQSEGHKQTPHCQICSHATTQQTPDILKNSLLQIILHQHSTRRNHNLHINPTNNGKHNEVPWSNHMECSSWYDAQDREQQSRLSVNTLRPRQNGRCFADGTFKRIFLNENVIISIKISLKFVPKGPINNIPALVQIMVWRWSGNKPLSEPMMVSLLTHKCVTRPQWVKKKPTGQLLR